MKRPTVVETFYPQFCFDCHSRHISRTVTNPCPYCGSEQMINHKREIYADVKVRKEENETISKDD